MASVRSTYRPSRERSSMLRYFLLSGLVLVLLRLVHLQVIQRDYYLEVVAPRIEPKQAEGLATTPGAILCRDGEPLAESVLMYHVIADPARMVKNHESFPVVAQQIAPIINLPAPTVLNLLENNRKRGYVELKQWVKQDTVRAINKLNIKGLGTRQAWRRQYPMGKAACQVVGGRDRFHQALSGLEYHYRLILDGRPGSGAAAGQLPSLATLNNGEATLTAIPGNTLVLTIDSALQRQAETEMDGLMAREKPQWASCVIMDPRTGELLAISSRPGYDPNAYVSGKPAPGYRWSAVPTAATKSWPVEAALEQGSTLKVLLAAAALSSNKINAHQHYQCSGHLDLGGRPISCWGKYATQGHGSLDIAGMLANSCNICAGRIALDLGRDYYRSYLAKCGIGEAPQAGFPGEAWGQLAKPSRIRPRDLATMGFGQNVSCSSLQLTSIIGGLVNNGNMMRPHVVAAMLDHNGSALHELKPAVERQLCTPEVSQQLRTMLEGVVVNGTGKAAAIPGVRVGGKTGTAQQWDAIKRAHSQDQYLVSFIMVFPMEQPRYVIHVACYRPQHGQHGSDVAAPVCQRLGKFILQQIDHRRKLAGSVTTSLPPHDWIKSGRVRLAMEIYETH